MPKLTKTLSAALLASLAMGAALPAQAAQYGNAPHHEMMNHDAGRHTPARAESIRNQIAELERRVARNDNRDRISEREAAGLRRDVARLRDQFRSYNRNGLTNQEFRTLQYRIDQIKARLQVERHDRDGRRW